MSSSEYAAHAAAESAQVPRTALYVRAPVYVRSSIGLEVIRFSRAGQTAMRLTLGPEEVRVPPGIYRVQAPRGTTLRVEAGGDEIDVVAVGNDGRVLPLPEHLHALFGEVSPAELERFFAVPAPEVADAATIMSPGTVEPLEAILSVLQLARPQRTAFSVTSGEDVRITIHASSDEGLDPGEPVPSREGALRVQLPPGLYRVHYERCGAVVEQLVDHGQATDLHHDGPPLITPAPITGAPTSHPYYVEPARRFSVHDSHSPIGAGPQTSRLFLFIRRESASASPPHLPSEPVTIHDLTGRQLASMDARGVDDVNLGLSLRRRIRALSRWGRAQDWVDDLHGYAVLSCRVAPGSYRIRAGWPRRDVAITVPAGRAAHVFIADRGALAIDDLRVSLVPVDRPFDPDSRSSRAMENAIFALRTQDGKPPQILRDLPLDAIDDDLCIGIASAHLALRCGDHDRFERLVKRLTRYDLPDIAILDRVLRGPRCEAPLASLTAPPLFRASLVLASTHPSFEALDVASEGAIGQAACAGSIEAIWCTWGARPWDERWIEPTIAMMRDRNPRYDAGAIARSTQLPRRIVERVIDRLDATVPRASGSPQRADQVRVRGYVIDQVLRRGAHGLVVRAHRELGGRSVALKIIPLTATERAIQRTDELSGLHRRERGHIVAFTDHDQLPDGAGVWFEMELCRGSLLDTVAERGEGLAPAVAVGYVLDALDGLASLHARGVAHGDIKPSNLLVREDGRVALGDLGFTAKLVDTGHVGSGRAPDSIRFSAPEQVRDRYRPLPASDVWSMAATLYFLLTLEVPRERYTDQTELEAAIRNPLVPIGERRPDLPDQLASIIDLALDPDPARRPSGAAELAARLLEIKLLPEEDRVAASPPQVAAAAHRRPPPLHQVGALFDKPPILEDLCRWLREWFDRSYCRIIVFDDRGERCRVAAAAAAPRQAGFAWSPHSLAGAAIADLPVFHEQEPIILDEAALRAAAPSLLPVPGNRLNELMIVPILTEGRMVGMLDLGECRSHRGGESPFGRAERRRPRNQPGLDGPADIVELARQAARIVARVLESERKRQLLERLEIKLQELQPEASTLWREIAHLGAELLGAPVGAVYVCHPNSGEYTLQARHGNRNLTKTLLASCRRGEGVVGGLDPDTRTAQRWPEVNGDSPFTRDSALKSALAIAIRGADIDAVLLVADDAARRFTDIDIDVLDRFVRHAAGAYRRAYLSPESRQLAQFKILHQINDLATRAEALDRVVHAVLTGITAGYGLGFNRAALFLFNEARTTLDGKMAIGNLTWEAASSDWQSLRDGGPQDFSVYLKAAGTEAIPDTPLHGLVTALSLPLDGEGDALRSAMAFSHLLLAESDLDRLPEAVQKVFDPDTQTQILLVRLMTTRPLGLVIVDNRFTKYPIGPDAIESLSTFASAAAIAIESFQVRDESKLVDDAIRALIVHRASDDPAAVMNLIVEEARKLCSAALAVFWPYYKGSGQFGELVSSNLDPTSKQDMAERGPSTKGIARRVLEKRYLVIDDVEHDTLILDPEVRRMLIRAGIRSYQGIALQIGNEPLGVLYVDYDQPRRFTEADQRLVSKFAMHAALALKISRLSRPLPEAQPRVAVFAKLAPLTDLERTCDDVANQIKHLLECDVVTLHVYNALTDAFERPARHAGALVDEEATRRYPEGVSKLPDWVMAQPEPIVVEDLEHHPQFGLTRFHRVEGIRSCLAFPLRASGVRVGALFANFHSPQHFTSDQILRGRRFADHAAAAIRNALRLRENEVLAQVTPELLHTESLQETLNSVARKAATMLGNRPVVSQVVLQEGNALVVRAVDGGDAYVLGTTRPRGRDSQTGFAVDVNEPVISNYEMEKRFTVTDELVRGFKSGMSVRMMAGGNFIGVLEVRSKRGHQFEDSHANLLSTLAAQAAMAIKSDQRSAEVRRRRDYLQTLRDAELIVERVRRGEITRKEVLDNLLQITVECYARCSLDATATTFGTLFLVSPDDDLVLEAVYPRELRPRFDEMIGPKRSLDVPPVGITGRAVLDGKPQLGLNLPEGHPDHLTVIETTRSEIAAPIIWHGSVVGVLDVESDSLRGFDQDDLDTLVTLAGFVALAFALANQGIAHILRAAQDLSKAMTASRDRARRLLHGAEQLLDTADRRDDLYELVGRMKRQLTDSEEQYRLTQDIMAAAMTVNEEPLNAKSTSLRKLIDKVVNGLAEAAAERHLALAPTVDGEDPITLWLDEDRIRQVITNIIVNAFGNALPPGKVEVEVKRKGNSDRVIVTVSDPGPNRPPKDDLPRLFEPFYLGEQGLGMSIAKTLVEAHGGKIWAEHNDRGGLNVSFDLATRPRPAPTGSASPGI